MHTLTPKTTQVTGHPSSWGWCQSSQSTDLKIRIRVSTSGEGVWVSSLVCVFFSDPSFGCGTCARRTWSACSKSPRVSKSKARTRSSANWRAQWPNSGQVGEKITVKPKHKPTPVITSSSNDMHYRNLMVLILICNHWKLHATNQIHGLALFDTPCHRVFVAT